MKTKIKTKLTSIRGKFMAALPVIVFFLSLFYSTILLFGISRAILVSVATILFKTNYQKNLTLKQILRLVATQFLMAGLAFCATINLPLTIVLNLLVPFLLVFLQASQFEQLRYFANAMCFTFLQLRPVGLDGLSGQMAAMAYEMSVLTVVLLFCSYKNKRPEDFSTARKGLLLLAEALRLQIDGCEEGTQAGEVFQILQGLYKEAYKSRGTSYVVTAKGKIPYMFALLFQRAVYFLTNPRQAALLKEPQYRGFLMELVQYMILAGEGGLEQKELGPKGRKLSATAAEHEGAPYVFAQNFLLLFLLILDHVNHTEEDNARNGWKRPGEKHPVKKFVRRMRTDTFETRFALRLSMVLTIGFVYSMVSQANHGYWLVLNAFLLLRPMYEDSASRMKSRFIGTIAGCVLLQVLLPIFHGTPGHFLLASLMATGLYMETAGTWQQAVFSTCFALTLTTMAIPQTLALTLRFVYVTMAVLLVLLVNRFFFPTSHKSQFRYNLQQLFHLHQLYLRILDDSLTAPVEYGAVCDIQIRYHLIHDQIIQYLKTADNEETDFIRELLWISWHMISEAEQMLFLLNSRKLKHLDAGQMEAYLILTADILSEIQKKMNMKADPVIFPEAPAAYKRSMEKEPRLSALMEQYSKQLSRLYLCVCRHVKNGSTTTF